MNKNWTYNPEKDQYRHEDGCIITRSYVDSEMQDWGRPIEQVHIYAVLDKIHDSIYELPTEIAMTNTNTNTTITEKKAEFLQIIEHANSCECARDHVYSETWLEDLIAVVQTESREKNKKELKAWKDIAEARETLLTFYRTGSRRGVDGALNKIDKARASLAKPSVNLNLSKEEE